MKKLAIYGGGGLGREVACLVKAINDDIPTWDLVGFFDDGLELNSSIDKFPVLGGIEEAANFDGFLVIALGNTELKQKIALTLKDAKFATLIHPKSIIMSNDVNIGKGCIITAGVVLTTSITVGDHSLINLNSTIGHDSLIGNYTSIMCGVNIAGNVTIGDQVLIGSGANVLSGLTIGNGASIGAGSVVNKNIKEGATAVGVPARSIKEGHD